MGAARHAGRDTAVGVAPEPAARRYVFPRPGDTLGTIAARELPGVEHAEMLLASWNLHLAVRRTPIGRPGELLCTDIVYVEEPRP